jgi:hypothetical protein
MTTIIIDVLKALFIVVLSGVSLAGLGYYIWYRIRADAPPAVKAKNGIFDA